MKCDKCGFITNPGDQKCIKCGAKLNPMNAIIPGVETMKIEPTKANNNLKLIIIIIASVFVLAITIFLIIKYLIIKG